MTVACTVLTAWLVLRYEPWLLDCATVLSAHWDGWSDRETGIARFSVEFFGCDDGVVLAYTDDLPASAATVELTPTVQLDIGVAVCAMVCVCLRVYECVFHCCPFERISDASSPRPPLPMSLILCRSSLWP